MLPPRRARAPVEEDDPFDFPDLPDSFSDQNQSRNPSSSAPPPQSQAQRGLQSTVLGTGPNGVGVITKLNTKTKPSTLTHGSIKLKNKAVAKTWEDDMDFEGDWGGTLKLKTLSKSKDKTKAPSTRKMELEDGGEMDGFDDDEEEDWEGTLKSKLKNSGMGTIRLGDTKGKGGIGLGLPTRQPLPDANLDDLGFDLDEDIHVDKGKAKTPKKVLPPNRFFVRPAPTIQPGPDALDDLDVFDFNENENENEDEATIKASAAMKALLPPPRIRPTPIMPLAQPLANAVKDNEDVEMDMGMDEDFALPLNLTNLTLVTRNDVPTGRHGPRASIASTNTDWNSPTTSASNDRWDSTPPSKRFSETSATSLSDGPNSSKLPQTPSSQVEDEDMEDGLVLPSKHFFKSTSKRELNSMLDRKRRPEYSASASPTRNGNGNGNGGRHRFMENESMTHEGLEDGLVFDDDPKAELTRKRLVRSKEARSQIPIPTRRSPSGKPSAGMPPPSTSIVSPSAKRERERTQSSVGVGHRHHSTGNSTLHGSPSYLAAQSQFQAASGSGLPPPGSGSGFKAFFSPTRPKSPLHSPAGREKERSRSGQAFVPMRIPQTPERGLRHQKSSSHLPSPSHHSASGSGSGLARKQSLSSLQDQSTVGASGHFTSVSSLQLHSLPEEPIKPGYATSSGSRLRDPTHALSSKVKHRLPLHGVFPPSSSSSSRISGLPASSSGSGSGPNSGSSTSTRSRLLHAQMKRRPYGDGTELESIEDLVVEDEEKGSFGSGSARSKCESRLSPLIHFFPLCLFAALHHMRDEVELIFSINSSFCPIRLSR